MCSTSSPPLPVSTACLFLLVLCLQLFCRFVLTRAVGLGNGISEGDSARTSLEKEKAKKLEQQSSEANKWSKFFFVGRLVFLAVALIAAAFLVHSIDRKSTRLNSSH